jgi:uncharacterized protein (DUF1778 family)
MRKREIVLTFRVNERERALLNELARARQCTRSQLVRELLHQHAVRTLQEEVRDEQRQRQ